MPKQYFIITAKHFKSQTTSQAESFGSHLLGCWYVPDKAREAGLPEAMLLVIVGVVSDGGWGLDGEFAIVTRRRRCRQTLQLLPLFEGRTGGECHGHVGIVRDRCLRSGDVFSRYSRAGCSSVCVSYRDSVGQWGQWEDRRRPSSAVADRLILRLMSNSVHFPIDIVVVVVATAMAYHRLQDLLRAG